MGWIQKEISESLSPTSSSTGVSSLSGSQSEELSIVDRISLARSRYSNRNFIEQWDLWVLEGRYSDAEKYYSVALSQSEKDPIIRQKYATTLAALKRFDDAQKTLEPIAMSLSGNIRSLYLQSYSKSQALSEQWVDGIKTPLSAEEREYYRIATVCIKNTENCIVSLNEYSGSGKLQTIKQSYQQSDHISGDSAYRDSLLAGSWYQAGESHIALNIITGVLEKRPDYMPAKEILGFSAYDLGDYTTANKYLVEYVSQHPFDASTLFALGQIRIQTQDWVGASDALNRAILAGYQPKIDVERKVIMVDAALKNYEHMMSVFAYILKDEKATENDYLTALLIATITEKKEELLRWSEQAEAKWSEDNDIKAYRAIAHITNSDLTEAEKYLSSTTKETTLTLYARALLALYQGDTTQSQELITKVEQEDREWILKELTAKFRASLAPLTEVNNTITP